MCFNFEKSRIRDESGTLTHVSVDEYVCRMIEYRAGIRRHLCSICDLKLNSESCLIDVVFGDKVLFSYTVEDDLVDEFMRQYS